MKLSYPLSLLMLVFAALPCTNGMAQGKGTDVEIKNAWVREAPPHAAVLGAYMTIENHSTRTTKLVNVSSPDFASVEMHRSIEKDGMMQMVRQSSIKIPASGKFLFKPGAYHLMLMKPKRALKAGDKVSLTLKFSNGSQSVVNAPVKKDTGSMDMKMNMDMNHDHGHDKGEMKH